MPPFFKSVARFGVNSALFGLPAATSYEMYRYGRKRKATGSLNGGSYKRRRLLYKRPTRPIRRRKFLYRRRRRVRPNRVHTALLRFTEEVTIPPETDYHYVHGWSTKLANKFDPQVTLYKTIYDQFKIVWIKRVNTMLEPTTLTDKKSEIGKWYKCYDMDGDGKLFKPTPNNYLANVGCKWGIAKPFENQSQFLYPKFAKQEWSTSQPIPNARRNWWDIGVYNNIGNSYNCIQTLYTKVPQERIVSVTNIVKIQFKGKRNGSIYET